MKEYELHPANGRKSFYGKAVVKVDDDGTETLLSYDTPIIKKKGDKLIPLYTGKKYGMTTATHVKSFCGISKEQYRKLLTENGMKFEED